MRATDRHCCFCQSGKLSQSPRYGNRPCHPVHPLLPALGMGSRSTTGQSSSFTLLVTVVGFKCGTEPRGHSEPTETALSAGGEGCFRFFWPPPCPLVAATGSISHFSEKIFLP